MAIEFGEEPRLASFSLAAVYLRLEKFSRALGLADELLLSDPRDAQAHALRGEASHRLGITGDARAAYQQAVDLNPTLAVVRLKLGELLAEQENWPPALVELEAAVKLAPTDVRALQALAGVLRRLRRSGEAVDVCRRALHCAAPKPELYLMLAGCCLDEGKLFDALVALRVAMSLDPQSEAGHRLMSQILAEQGRHPEAQLHAAAADRLKSLGQATEASASRELAAPIATTNSGRVIR